MKDNKLELVFVMMVFLVLITAIMGDNTTTEKENIDIDSDLPSNFNTSANWYLTINNISIDDAATGIDAHNWTWAEKNDWCRGSGVLGDPYIIENITMNGLDSESGIKIENSNAYFIIQNCTIFSSGTDSMEDAGITLVNTTNGIIRNNDCSYNYRCGIFLKNGCSNINISNNDVYEKSYSWFHIWNGIYLYNQCNYNIIEGNTIYYSEDNGIYLEMNCNYNLIKNNIVNYSGNGIFIKDNSVGNVIFNNTLLGNINNGLYISMYCNDNIVSNNKIYDNYDSGIYVNDHCNDNIVENNTIYNNVDCGICFKGGCEYITITNNTIYQNKDGIKVDTSGGSCKYYNISENIVNNNLQSGIYLYYVMYTNVWENKLSGCGFIIESNNINHHRSISVSTNNTVNGKPVYYCVEKSNLYSSDFDNAGQIILIDCNHTNLANFNFSFCSIGIYIYGTFYWGHGSYNHTISNITLQGSLDGIYLERSHNANISNITAKRNDDGIHVVECNNTKIDNCTLKDNNNDGLFLSYCFYSNVTNLSAVFNKGNGISLYGSEECNIFNNTLNRNDEEGLIISGGVRNCIYGNKISYNNKSGIYLWSSSTDYNLIENNTISFNKEHGISLDYGCNDNNIRNNSIFSNEMNGIYVYGYFTECINNNFKLNNIYKNGENGIFLNYYCKNNNITLNQIYNNENHGIYIFSSSDSNIISNNTVYNNAGQGIYLYANCHNCNITGNIIENKNHGIYIQDSENVFMTENKLNFCGVFLSGTTGQIKSHQIDDTNQINHKKLYYYVDQDRLEDSSFSNAGQIILINCRDSFISNVNVSSGSVGIMLYLCDNITIKETNSSYNNLYGINVEKCNNTKIIDNTLNNNTIGIYLHGDYLESKCYFNNITGNQIIFNVQYGIFFTSDCLLNQIIGNNISYNGKYGIYLESGSNNNTIYRNKISFNNKTGIYLSNADYNIIVENTINDNVNHGIYIYYSSEYTTIYNNNISNNKYDGIRLIDVWNGVNIIQNKIIHNWQNGIFLQYSYNSYITKNLIERNLVKGLRLEGGSDSNLIYNNSFINNADNAEDNGGIMNFWDDGSLGNFWNDYTGGDNNNDGIGDTPYNIPGSAGSKDNYPIWGKPSIGAGLLSNREDDSSDGKDNEQSSDNMTTYILGGLIIGSIVAIYFGLKVYSKKHPLRKSKISKEPFLESPQEEVDQLKTKETTIRTPQTKSTAKKSESYLQKSIGIDDFDQHFIQEKLRIRPLKTNDLYDEAIRNNSIISNYLESDISIDDIPDGEKLLATTLSEEDFQKIDLIDLPANDKKIFLMEILSLNKTERKTLLDNLIQNVE